MALEKKIRKESISLSQSRSKGKLGDSQSKKALLTPKKSRNVSPAQRVKKTFQR